MHYQMKAVVFDILAGCRGLKAELIRAGIAVTAPFLGLCAEETLRLETEKMGLLGEEVLFITNNESHAGIAAACGMAVVGCMEGHFEVPKVTVLLESPEEVSVAYLNLVYCHAKGIPAVILETNRVYLKELSEENMDRLYEILTDEEVSRYLPAKAGSREEELEKLISYVSCVYPFFEYGYWGIFSKETGELIGRAGFREGSYPPEAGYVICRESWGRGLATEILTALVSYAGEELGAEEVLVTIDKANRASVRVAEKCGFLCQDLRNGEGEEKEKSSILYFSRQLLCKA